MVESKKPTKPLTTAEKRPLLYLQCLGRGNLNLLLGRQALRE